MDESLDSSRVEPGDDLGRVLRAARVERGLDPGRLAAQLHLNRDLIEALEAGRYEDLPGPVFVAGYIRNYARQVGLDPEPLVAAYLSAKRNPASARIWSRPRVTPSDRGSSGFWIRLVTVLLVAGIAYLFVQWWQNRLPTLPEPAQEPAQGPAQELAARQAPSPPSGSADAAVRREGSPARSREVTVARDGSEPGSEGASPAPQPERVASAPPSPPSPAPLAEAPAAPATAQSAATPATSPASPGRAEPLEPQAQDARPGLSPDGGEPSALDEGSVVLEFRGPCWVDVRDSAKSFSLTGEMTKGDRRVLGGTPPYSLILGNAAAVTVVVKGTVFDLTSVTKGNVARFKLDPAARP